MFGGVLRPCSFWCIHFMLIVAWDLMCRHSLLLFYLYYGGNSLSFAIKRNIGVTDRCWVNLGGYSFFFFFFWRVAWWTKASSLFCQPVFDILYLNCAATLFYQPILFQWAEGENNWRLVYILAFCLQEVTQDLEKKILQIREDKGFFGLEYVSDDYFCYQRTEPNKSLK